MKIYYFAPLKFTSVASFRFIALKKNYKNVIGIHNPIDIGILNGGAITVWLYKVGIYKNYNFQKINKKLIKRITPDKSKGILILDKAQCISIDTLTSIRAKCPNYVFVNYNPDNEFCSTSFGWSLYMQCLPIINLIFSMRDSNVKQYKRLGVNFAHLLYGYSKERDWFSRFQYCKKIDSHSFLFVGTFAYRRAVFLLLGSFIVPGKIEIWGDRWGILKYWPLFKCHSKPIYNQKFRDKVKKNNFIFCFFNRRNKDEQNTRLISTIASYKIIVTEKTSVTKLKRIIFS